VHSFLRDCWSPENYSTKNKKWISADGVEALCESRELFSWQLIRFHI